MVGVKKTKGRIYDAANVLLHDVEQSPWESPAYVTEEATEEDMLDALIQEGDEDAFFSLC